MKTPITYFEYLFRNSTTRFFTISITLITLAVPISEYFRDGSVILAIGVTSPVYLVYLVGHYLNFRKYKTR